jgi:DNA repair exonuclease SbcCD ATPase subunit
VTEQAAAWWDEIPEDARQFIRDKAAALQQAERERDRLQDLGAEVRAEDRKLADEKYRAEFNRAEAAEAELSRVKGELRAANESITERGSYITRLYDEKAKLRTCIEEVAQELEGKAENVAFANALSSQGMIVAFREAASLVRKAAKGEGE